MFLLIGCSIFHLFIGIWIGHLFTHEYRMKQINDYIKHPTPFWKERNLLRIHDLIDDETKKLLRIKYQHEQERKSKPIASHPVDRPARPKPSLSKREIEELMGVRRDTYKRVNGKVKRK